MSEKRHMESFEFLVAREVITREQYLDAEELARLKGVPVWKAINLFEYAALKDIRLAILIERGITYLLNAEMQSALQCDTCPLCGQLITGCQAANYWHVRDEKGRPILGQDYETRCDWCFARLLTGYTDGCFRPDDPKTWTYNPDDQS